MRHQTTIMRFDEFDALYKQQVYFLTYREGLDLAVEVCKRLYFDYEQFVSKENWGDKDLLMDAITLCDRSKRQLVDESEIEELLTKVDAVTPDTDDFGDYLGSYALNSALSVYETLQFIVDKDFLHVYHIGTYLIDTTDFKLHENSKGKIVEEQANEHPTMVEARKLLLDKTSGWRTTSALQYGG